MLNKFKQLLVSVALSLVASNVVALPSIDGSLQMTGAFNALDASGKIVSDANKAVAIDFDFWGMDMFRVTKADGDFTGLDGGLGNITDFQFAPFSGPIVDFWTIADFSFELTEIARTNNSSTFIDLHGAGFVSAAGFEDTFAEWRFSGGSAGGGVFSWSATSEPTAVPEPGVLALLSLGLISISFRNKLKKQ